MPKYTEKAGCLQVPRAFDILAVLPNLKKKPPTKINLALKHITEKRDYEIMHYATLPSWKDTFASGRDLV